MAKKAVLNKKEVEASQQAQQEFEQKVLINNPRKLILGVTNPYLASEFAFHVAKYTNIKVLLIDADGLNPMVNMTLGMKEVVNERIQTDFKTDSAFNMALNYLVVSKGSFNIDVFKSIAVKHPKNSNLSVLTSNDDLEMYEGYSSKTFELLIQKAVLGYDLIVVNVPYNIYDEFYLETLKYVEYMIYGFDAYADNMVNFNRLIHFLNSIGISDLNKHQYVAFNHSLRTKLSVSDIKMVVDNNFLGSISGEKSRLLMNNEFLKSYSNNMSKKNIKEYHKLAKTFGYSTKKKGLFNKKQKGRV